MQDHARRRPILVLLVALMVVWFGAGVAQRGAQAVAWSPASLSGLEFWIDPSDVSTVTYSGGVASGVNDKSGNGRHIEQSDSDKQPNYGVTTKNGLKVMSFDGNDNLRSGNWTQNQPVTMFAVAQNSINDEDDYGNRQIVGNTNPVSPTFYVSGQVWRLYAGRELISNTVVDTDWHYLTGVVNSGSSRYRLDGQVIKEGNAGGKPWDDSPISIGDSAESWGSFGWVGGIAEVLIYSRILTGAEITQVETYLDNKWAVTVPESTTTTVPPTTTTVAPTTTTTVVPASTTTTTTVVIPATTAPPALVINVSAPTTAPASAPQTSLVPVTKSLGDSSGGPLVGNAKGAAATTTVPPTTTTQPNNAGGTVAPVAPTIDAVTPGAASVKVGGTATEARIERSNNQLVVSAGPITATLGALDSSGAVTSLDPDGNVRLKPGDPVRINVSGFKPGSSVQAWLFSTPVLLGMAKVSGTGDVAASFTIPKNIPAGAHRIAIVATTVDGKPATLAVGVKVGEWKKETSVVVWLILLPILLAAVGALVLPATRRRRRVDTP